MERLLSGNIFRYFKPAKEIKLKLLLIANISCTNSETLVAQTANRTRDLAIRF